MWIISLYTLSFLLFLSAVKAKFYDRKMEIIYLSLIFALFVLIASFRDYSSYPDFIGYTGYENQFYRFGQMDFGSFFNVWNDLKDPVYHFLGLCAYKIGIGFRLWIVLIAAFDLIAVLIHIKKYSNNYGLSFLMFLSLGYYFFMLCGLRQSLAIALVLFAYDAAKKHKLLLFSFLILLAYLFHQSAIIFLPFYFVIAKKRIEKKHIWILLIFILIVSLNFNELMSLLALESFENNDRFSHFIDPNREGLNATNIIIFASLFIYCIMVRRNNPAIQLNHSSPNQPIFDSREDCLILILVACFFRALSMITPESFRLAMYFDIFIISFLPKNTRPIHFEKMPLDQFLIPLLFWAYFLLFSSKSFFVFAGKGHLF